MSACFSMMLASVMILASIDEHGFIFCCRDCSRSVVASGFVVWSGLGGRVTGARVV